MLTGSEQTCRSPRARPVLFELRSSTSFIVLSASVAYFQDGFLYASVVPVLPFSLHERSGVPQKDVQFWNSTFLVIFGVFQTLGGPGVGWWADHSRSRRLPFLFGILCAFASTILFMLAKSIWILIIARILQGTAAAIVNTLSLALLADTVEKSQLGFWMGLALSGMTLGVLIGPPLAAVVYERVGYSWVFVVALAIVAVDAILRSMIIEKKDAEVWKEQSLDSAVPGNLVEPECTNGNESDGIFAKVDNQSQPPDEATPLLSDSTSTSGAKSPSLLPTSVLLLTSPPIAAAVYGCMVNATLITAFDASLPIFVAETFSWTAEKAGAILLALTVVPLLGFIPGALADRYGTSRIALIGFVLSTLCILLMGMIDNADVAEVVSLTVLLFFSSIGMSLFLSPLAASLPGLVESLKSQRSDLLGSGEAMAQVYSIFNAALGVGTILGPILSGAVYHYKGWFWMCVAVAATCFSGSIPVILFMKDQKLRPGL